MEAAPFFVSIFKKRFRDFLSGFKLYKEGHKSRHDLNCDMVDLLHDYQDMAEEFEVMLKDDGDQKGSRPLPEHMEDALMFVRLYKKSFKVFLHEFKLYREGHKSKHDLNCDMVDLLRNLQYLVAEFGSILGR
ncbi:hypothetical protein SADUNF_Sadunf04G0062400 [Salix dunnii]|uniref:Uncharacterized protein n=1 Tax=Salix dunnii TaxID=1413687 RepID=A0A835N3X3_9ROSI|nr:hypothetical protein SADUNF_Sadunf04G0062400 [Salix dunnii]